MALRREGERSEQERDEEEGEEPLVGCVPPSRRPASNEKRPPTPLANGKDAHAEVEEGYEEGEQEEGARHATDGDRRLQTLSSLVALAGRRLPP